MQEMYSELERAVIAITTIRQAEQRNLSQMKHHTSRLLRIFSISFEMENCTITWGNTLSSLVRTVKVEDEDLGGEWKGNLAAVIFHYRLNVSSLEALLIPQFSPKKDVMGKYLC